VGIVIDSSVLIAWERDQLDLETQMARYAEEDFAISAVTASELLHGVHRGAGMRAHWLEACVLVFLCVTSVTHLTSRTHRAQVNLGQTGDRDAQIDLHLPYPARVMQEYMSL
jgi:predicted nucleic acid-binding protein